MQWQRILDVLGGVAAAAGIAGVYYAWRALDAPTVEASQKRFCQDRDKERQRFTALNEVATVLHLAARPSMRRIGDSCVLIDESMMPAAPMPLAAVRVDADESSPPFDTEFRALARRVLPKQARRTKFESYSAALGALMRPTLWEDRFCYRIVSTDWRAAGGPRLVLGEGSYFDLIDQSGPLTRELSAAIRRPAGPPPAWRRLPLRARFKADPLSLGRRVVLASVGTLTIRRTADGQGTFYALHRRKGQTAIGDDTYNVLPGGMLQPASLSSMSRRSDLSVWRNIMREYNEEMLGAPEATGDLGIEADYTRPPYSDFEQALTDGTLRVWTFGMGLEALILTPVLLTIAVFEADVFDALFANLVPKNDEGIVITKLPLRDAEVGDLLKSRNVAPPLAALLHLALQHRDLLLSAPARAA